MWKHTETDRSCAAARPELSVLINLPILVTRPIGSHCADVLVNSDSEESVPMVNSDSEESLGFRRVDS